MLEWKYKEIAVPIATQDQCDPKVWEAWRREIEYSSNRIDAELKRRLYSDDATFPGIGWLTNGDQK